MECYSFNLALLGYLNTFVSTNITLSSTSKTVYCTFLNSTQNSTKTCSVTIAYGTNCKIKVQGPVSEDIEFGDTVMVNLGNPFNEVVMTESIFCINVTASDGITTVVVENEGIQGTQLYTLIIKTALVSKD